MDGLRRLLRPLSIAIVGASEKIGPGLNAWKALELVGYQGRVHLVNPNRSELFGQPTVSCLAAIDEQVDAVFVAVPRDAALLTVRQAAALEAGGVALLTSGFAEAGPDGVRAQRELAEVASARGLAVCGPNCLGLLNFAGRSALFGTSLPDRVARGGVAAIVQSGSVGIALLNAGRGLGLAYLITSGNEAVTTAADYVDALVDDPAVTVIIAFLEQLREPRRFMTAARRAHAAGKPVIVVKTGRSERGRRAVLAHTGAVAGSDEACDAAFRAAGAIRVDSLDELIETAVLVSTVRSRPAAPGVAMLSPSGGEIALALDIAESAGLDLPAVEAAKPDLAALLPDFATVGNPLDITWAGLYDPTISRRLAAILGARPEVGALVLLQDAPRDLNDQQSMRYANLVRAVGEGAGERPLVVVSNLAGDFHPAYESAAREHGVPCLRGTQEGLFAVARWMRWALAPPATPVTPTAAAVRAEAERLLAAVPAGRGPSEQEARAVLACYGIRGPRESLVKGPGEAVAAARALGYPVVLKAMVADVVHKTEHGLVRVGLRADDEVAAVAVEMAERARGMGQPLLGLLVQEHVTAVGELIVGGRVDPDFGPVIVLGGGGVTVELYRDVAVRLAPVTEAEARAMLDQTKAAALLRGWRGLPAADVEAVAAVTASLSRLVADLADRLDEVEINPLAVLPAGRGALALDAVIARHAS